ncbi:MAG: hypothetical protein RLZZ584_1660 [Pseudomonadota bacterium]
MAKIPTPTRAAGVSADGGSASPSDPAAMRTPAELAKAALRRIAVQRQEPTPANFARAWREEGGDDRPEPLPAAARQAIATLAARVLPAGAGRSALADALASQQWDGLGRLLDSVPASPARDAQHWAELIARLTRHLERGSRLWTTGRKKDSLQHVLNSSRSDVERLQQRLGQLLGGWDDDAPDPGAAEAAPPEPDTAGAAPGAVDHPAQPLPQPALTSPEIAPPASGLSMAPASLDQAEVPAAPVDPDPGVAGGGAPCPAPGLAAAAPAAAAAPVRLDAAVELLHASVQAALPGGDQRAAEVGRRLAALAGSPAQAARVQGWLGELEQACGDVDRVLAHRHHYVDQLCRLVGELTDSLGELAEDESWVAGQVAVMQQTLRGEGGDGSAGAECGAVAAATLAPAALLGARGVRSVAELLRATRERQRVLRLERAQARDALRELIRRILQDLGELGSHTGRFSDSMSRYASVIAQADTLQGLAGVVREMVDETRAVHDLVSATTRRIDDEHRVAGELALRVRQLEDEIRRLSDEVSTDPLTQIANRRGLLRHFEVEQASQAREGHALAVGLLDIDNFKKLNDTLGHQAGDAALQFLSRRVGELLRPQDTLARYGGEEFVVLLPATALDEAEQALTRLQRLLSAELFMHEDRQTFVTFSAGVTLYRPGEALEAALQRADEALYEAKRTGKNRTCRA